jgi:hypothetical protein
MDPVTDPGASAGQSGQWGEMARLGRPPLGQLLLSRLIGLIGMPGDANSAITDASGKIAGWLGEDPEKIAAFKKAVEDSPLNFLPTSESIAKSRQAKSLAAAIAAQRPAWLAQQPGSDQ